MLGINKAIVQFGLHYTKNLVDFTQTLQNKYDGYENTKANISDTYTKIEIDAKIASVDDIKIQVDIYADLPITFYDSPANLKPVALNDLAYVNNASSGLFGIINRKPAGIYKFDGTAWVVSYDYSSIVASINQARYTWSYYINTWTQTPTQEATLSNGSVYRYIYGNTTTYRFVPSPYSAIDDAFYNNFDGTNLTNKIVSRG